MERTGNYHLPPKRAFADAGFETRVVHPFATKQYRMPADPGNKTDETDLHAQHRAAVAGFGLRELELESPYRELQLRARHRRNLVEKGAAMACQISEHLHLVMPGYANLFDRLFESPVALAIGQRCGSPAKMIELGRTGLSQYLREQKIAYRGPTLDQIVALEQELTGYLVQTPYVRLMAIPGINVVSAAELAAEMGPITQYANANATTGRSGLYPSRFQCHQRDGSGPLIRKANRRLRCILMRMADNLACHCKYYRGQAESDQYRGIDKRASRVKIAKRFSRLALACVAGDEPMRHSCFQQPDPILEKLRRFHHEHATPIDRVLADLETAVEQLPYNTRSHEAEIVANVL